MKIKFPVIICSLFLGSCTYFSNKVETMASSKSLSEKIEAITPLTRNNFCTESTKMQYITEDENSAKFYKKLNNSLFENKNIPFIQKAIMLSLIEMSKRPEEATPFSRLQIYLKINGQNYYYDFRPKSLEDDSKMSYLYGLDFLTKNFLKQKTLATIASELDTIVPNSLSISSELEKFLRQNQADLSKSDELSSRFLKGDETLTRYETFRRQSFKSIIDVYQNPIYSKAEYYEFDKNGLIANSYQVPNFEANCNYDLAPKKDLQNNLASTDLKKSHTIGMAEGSNFYLAVSSATLFRPLKTVPKLDYFMKARPSPLPLPICEFKSKSQEIVLFSSNGRNPNQHLQHLISYEIDKIQNSNELNELLNFSRHLFLTNPDRILYESKRGRKAQLDFFLSMNFPIYHVESLGNIFGHALFKKDKSTYSSLHIDDRNQARLWCGQ